MRVRDNELEGVTREVKALRAVAEGVQAALGQAMRENDQMKGVVNDQERGMIQMKGLLQGREAQVAQLEGDVHRLKTVIEKERMRSNKVEEEYQIKIESL